MANRPRGRIATRRAPGIVAGALTLVLATACTSNGRGVASAANARSSTTASTPTSSAQASTDVPGLTATTVAQSLPISPAPTTSAAVRASATTTLPTTSPPTTAPSPGVPADMLNRAVTQATISSTICVRGYTATVRPPVSFTEPLKVHQIATYHYTDTRVGDYEEDHVVALEIGGAPAAAANLFPEPHSVSPADDTLENDLHSQVCRGQISLAAAQLRLFAVKVAHGYSRSASVA